MTRARILADYVAGGTTAAEFDYMDGVTSNVQTQLDAKLPLAGGTMTGDLVPATPMSHRNMIINGDMRVSQRATAYNNLSSATKVIDRYTIRTSGASGAFDVTQDANSPVGFNNSLKITNDATETIDGTSDYLGISYKIEAQDCQQLGYGSATAKTSTLSFWVRSTVTGTGVIYIQIEDDSYKQWSGSYTISASDTWEYKTLTIPANTTSTINDDNGLGLDINWFIFAGSAYSSGGSLSSSWEAAATNKQGYGQTNFMGGATGRIFQITGIQFELGSNATPFEHRTYSEELAKCMRYFQKYRNESSGNADMVTGWAQSTSAARLIQPFPVWMRVGPSLTYPQAATTMYVSDGVSASNQCSALTAHAYMSDQIMDIAFTANNSDLTAFRHYYLFLGAASETYYLGFDAEL